MTIVVTDLDDARHFFGLLGFEETKAVVIAGEAIDKYMGVAGLEADHVTLTIPTSSPHQEIQLLHYRSPDVTIDAHSGQLTRTGFNHVCFRVPDLDAAVGRLADAGIKPRNQPMVFHDRKLVFFDGPSNVVVEFAEWL